MSFLVNPQTGSGEVSALYRVIYASIAEALTKRDIEGVLDSSEKNNFALGVTGALVFTSRFFLQILEGERRAVDAIYTKIRKDRRHHSIATIAAHAIPERLFGGWSMRYFSERQLSADLRKAIAPDSFFRPQAIAPEAGLRLIQRLATD